MTFFRLGFGYGIPNTACLDEEFDTPDVAADRELCRAIVAGKWGLHPDAWADHDPLTTLPPRVRQYEPPAPAGYERPVESPIKPWRLRPWRQPPEVPGGTWAEDKAGDLQLTCDECGRRYRHTLPYPAGQRPAAVAAIRQLAACVGWTCIVGCDRCPRCTTIILQAAAPEPVGDGAGEDDRDEQDA